MCYVSIDKLKQTTFNLRAPLQEGGLNIGCVSPQVSLCCAYTEMLHTQHIYKKK